MQRQGRDFLGLNGGPSSSVLASGALQLVQTRPVEMMPIVDQSSPPNWWTRRTFSVNAGSSEWLRKLVTLAEKVFRVPGFGSFLMTLRISWETPPPRQGPDVTWGWERKDWMNNEGDKRVRNDKKWEEEGNEGGKVGRRIEGSSWGTL